MGVENKEKRKEYHEKNKERFYLIDKLRRIQKREHRAKYAREKRIKDKNYHISCLLRGRINYAIRGKPKPGSAIRDLGCTISEFKFYLEGKFQEGMTWENKGLWHIDHIIPLASFDLTNREQFLKACHYTNLQPLWARENLSKGKKLISSF